MPKSPLQSTDAGFDGGFIPLGIEFRSPDGLKKFLSRDDSRIFANQTEENAKWIGFTAELNRSFIRSKSSLHPVEENDVVGPSFLPLKVGVPIQNSCFSSGIQEQFSGVVGEGQHRFQGGRIQIATGYESFDESVRGFFPLVLQKLKSFRIP